MEKIKVMIIDDQAFSRAGVRWALSQQSDFEILDCDPSQDILGLIESSLPGVVLLGSDLVTHIGLELGRLIARNYPNTKVIMLSPAPNDEELFEVIKTATVACLNKNTSGEELASTIRRASHGEYPINNSLSRPVVAQQVLKQFQNLASMGKAMETIVAPLTHRETQILNHVADGNTNKQIARIMRISKETVKSHVSTILHKLNANDRAHAAVLAVRLGWLPTERNGENMLAVS